MVYFSSNSEYFEDFIENLIFHVNASNGIALQWKNWYFVWYFLKTWYFNETHWMRLHYSEKIGIFLKFLDITWNCENIPNGSKLSLEKGYFIEICNISVEHTERYGIQLKNLVFFSNFSKISKFPVILIKRDSFCLKKLIFLLKQTIFHDKTSVGRRLSFENWLKSIISLKLGYFMKI